MNKGDNIMTNVSNTNVHFESHPLYLSISSNSKLTNVGKDVTNMMLSGCLDKQQSKDVPGKDAYFKKMDQEKLAAGYENPADALDEGLGYAMPGQDEESERVSYSKTKKQGDASVTVSANAASMDDEDDMDDKTNTWKSFEETW